MSEQYIVSARKYRPQTFDTVVGQQHITDTLKNAIKNKQLAHAFLFCGPRGVGKTTCARILAKTINCLQITPEGEACGTCTCCRSVQENSSMNVFELDAASNNSVEDIRLLNDQVRVGPSVGQYKVYIIDEVHMLSTAAFNAFLKTLEEPPTHAIFILATTEKHKILPTILSRCQIFDFKRIKTSDVVSHLQAICQKEDTQCDEPALHLIATQSEGCMRDALSILDRVANFGEGKVLYQNTANLLNILDAETYFRFTDYLLAQDYGATLLMLEDLLQKGFESINILHGLAAHLRSVLLCKDGKMAALLDISELHRPQYQEYALRIPEAYLISALRILNEAEMHYAQAMDKRMHTELCFIKLAHLNDAVSLTKLLQDEQVKKN